ncbi:Thiol-disulfide oxidoreductase ResA [Polystyrenella longa]|uniref:Thiol-disulfide oxidoreductase ResA n=1 Tax=Polystyrenella longa TaxID=2528007 RepID=A0A518CN80_9PLAN|nr:TlpA disulfide reductase family protein [Polystyrenella longa]QDU80680.1 Thiol-disulfide oxidoreductase ResA [Polystyrenella longa]
MRCFKLFALSLLPLFCIVGCTPASEAESTKPEENNVEAESPAPIEVVYGDLKDVQEFIAKQDGKVVVLDTWSTWCLPCLREFPNLVALQKQFPEDVVCVSLNLNYDGIEGEPPTSFEEDVLVQLRKYNATLTNYICTQESEEVYESLQFDSLPAVFVYDKAGNLVKRFDNSQLESPDDEFTYKKDIIPQVKALLDAK